MQRKTKARNVLISRFSALGDVAMTLPSVYDACTASPDTRFYFLTRHHPAGLFINAPANLTVVGVDPENYKGVGGLWRLAASLRRRYGIDLVVDLHDVLRTKLLRIFMNLRGVPSHHINKGRDAKKALTRRRNKMLVQLTRTTDRYADTFRRAGLPLSGTFRSLYGDGKGPVEAFAEVTAPRREGERWIAIAPFAKHKGKMYPIEHIEKVVEHFDRQPGLKIFIFGFGDNERAQIARLAGQYKSVVNMAEHRIGFAGELSLLSHCDVMLSMDSANMHLASLVGLRCVSVWGATHPYTGFLGWHQDIADTVQLDMVCRPCSVFGDKPCARGDYYCLRGISPRTVIHKLEQTE